MFGQKGLIEKLRLRAEFRDALFQTVKQTKDRIAQNFKIIDENKDFNKASKSVYSYKYFKNLCKTHNDYIKEIVGSNQNEDLTLDEETGQSVEYFEEKIKDAKERMQSLLKKDKNVEKYEKYVQAIEQNEKEEKLLDEYMKDSFDNAVAAMQLKKRIRKLPEDLIDFDFSI